MKRSVLLFCALFIIVFFLPAAVAGAEAVVTGPTTEPVIIGGVTRAITREPTAEPTKEPVLPPVTEPTAGPAPQIGWITIASTPSGASATLDGHYVGATPVAGLEVASGTSHTVRVTMDGYEPAERSVSVSAGEQAAADLTLTPIVTPEPTPLPTPERPIGSDKGWIRVNCNVDGATASLDDHSSGCTIAQGSCSIEVTVTGTPARTYTVQKPGYSIFTGAVPRMPSKGETVDVYATLDPIPVPKYGSIQVTSYPSNAVASLDGLTWQYTPCTFSALSAGTNHNIQISLGGYKPQSRTVMVPADQTVYVNVNLAPNPPYPNTGSLNVATSPKGADIYVDGQYMAQSPSIVPGLIPGVHSLRLHKAGYDEYVNTFTISAGQQTPVAVTLSAQSGNVGSIQVASTPAGSALYLDGNYMGLTPLNDYFDLTSLTPGSHTILLRYTDYQDYTKNVYVAKGGVATVSARLIPVSPGPQPDTTGQVVIASSPTGAEVYLDNVYKGVSPVTLTDIAAGSHMLTLKEAGYQDVVQTVTVNAGQSTPVAVTLALVAPSPTKSPLTMATVLGAVIVLGTVLVLKRR